MAGIAEMIGRFHPLLVHLPIGILLLAALFYWLSKKEKYSLLKDATAIALFWGMISAVGSCISGYLLSLNGDYDEDLAGKHKWFGIAIAIVSIIVYLFHRWENGFEKWSMILLILLIFITGHLGGSLTHGSDYLFKSLNTKEVSHEEMKAIANIQEADIYADLVRPLMENKCYTCHSRNKKKGGLRLDEPSFILKGGEDGNVIKPGNAEKSNLIKRLLLPRNHDDHMPPKEKSQLKENEVALLQWWVAVGAPFDKKVKELAQTEKIKPVLLSFQSDENKVSVPEIPMEPVTAADEKVVNQLKESGTVVLPVAEGSNYLSVNFLIVDTVDQHKIDLLHKLIKQIVWLKLSNKKIGDEELKKIADLSNLTKLQLDYTQITDDGLASLKKLKNLQSLNLVGTDITVKGVSALKELPMLQHIYLYKTKISGAEWAILKNDLPKVSIDTGGYHVPVLKSDTTIVTSPAKK